MIGPLGKTFLWVLVYVLYDRFEKHDYLLASLCFSRTSMQTPLFCSCSLCICIHQIHWARLLGLKMPYTD